MFTISCPVSRRRDGRSPLLLAAALAVAVPGLLATACSSQGSTGTARAGPAATASSAAASGAAAVAPRAAERVAGPAAAKRTSSARAVALLAQAAQAAIGMTYQGEEITTRWSDGSGSVVVSDIWHASGGQTVTRSLTTGTTFSSQPYLSADSDGQAPEGVLGVTAPLVQLLESHYVVVYAGTGSADDRAAQVVEAWRADGSLAARFWLDSATKLPLERQVYDSTAHVISQDLFINVQFAAQASAPAGAPSDLTGPWSDLMTESQLLALRSHGWVVPTQLPGGLTLFTGAQTTTSTGTVVDLGYSDGLNVVSVFEEHGHLATGLAGWQQTTVAGHVIYVAEPGQRSLTWASKDIVYTVMADAPAQTVDAVVGALPHDAPPGFWKRISRGLARLASVVNPFR